MNLQRMKQLAGIKLNESVVAIPGVGQGSESGMQTAGTVGRNQDYAAYDASQQPATESRTLDEKSTSEKQARFMAAAAHNPAFAKRAGIDAGVAKEFNQADTGTSQLSNAMKHNTEEACMDEAYGDFRQHYQDANKPSTFNPSREQAPKQADFGDHPIMAVTDRVHDAINNAIAKRQAKKTPTEEGEMFHPDHDAVHGAMSDSDYNQHQEMQQDAREAFNDYVRGYLTKHYSEDSRFSDDEVSEVATAMGCDESEVWQAMEDMGLLDSSDREPGEGGPDNYMGDAEALASAGHGSNEDYGDFDEALDLSNGYGGTKADGEDFFPDGADSPVVDNVGPSGSRQGDNPEQKKMQVAEVHKELVYGYRNYLKESALTAKKKS